MQAKAHETRNRVLRTLIQLIAGGALTELFTQIASDVPEGVAPYILILSTLLVTGVQNYLEEHGVIAPILKAPSVRSVAPRETEPSRE